MGLADHPISAHSLDASPIWAPMTAAELRLVTMQKICLVRDGFRSDITFFLTALSVNQCIYMYTNLG
jgi:hypothetical protein